MMSLERPDIAVLLVDGSEVMMKPTEEEAFTETLVIATLVLPTVEEDNFISKIGSNSFGK